jgi:dephospho-CoA kinase
MRIAVTGGIAEGKSTVMRYLRELGQETASADEIARQVFQLPEVQAEIAEAVGLLLPLDPTAVRERISSSPDARRQVNAVTHPRILARIEGCPATWVEVPLLFEACLQGRFDRIWVATCGADEQLRRLRERLGDEDGARRLIATQLPTEVKLAFADEIVRTIGSEPAVKSFVEQGIERELSN